MCTYLPRAWQHSAYARRCCGTGENQVSVSIFACVHDTQQLVAGHILVVIAYALGARTCEHKRVRKASQVGSVVGRSLALTDSTGPYTVQVCVCKCCAEITGTILHSPVLAVTTSAAVAAAAAAYKYYIIPARAERACSILAYRPECEAKWNREHV